MLNNAMMTSHCQVMTSRCTSRWRLKVFRTPWPLKHMIQYKNDKFVQLVPEMLTNVMMTSRCHVVTSRYASRWRLYFFRNASRWRLYFFRNPWPLKRRIRNKHDVIRASSPGDMCFNQPIHLSLVTTCALVFSLRQGKVNSICVYIYIYIYIYILYIYIYIYIYIFKYVYTWLLPNSSIRYPWECWNAFLVTGCRSFVTSTSSD